MVELMKQPGVSELGRVSHQEVAKLMMSSGVFAYPCHFEEIYCIAAAKAQMAGCVPVVGISNNCLDETVKIGVHIRGDMKSPEGREMFSKELIKILKDEELQREVGVKAREKAMAELDWGKVAEEWIKHFTV
jgi:glycosyltransferase involved in cell wall biosynthesis